MKRFHVHVSVDDLAKNIAFYSGMFGAAPTVEKQDYAKWMLEDPRINFAISKRGSPAGVDHLGVQVESDEELAEAHERLVAAETGILDQPDAACCYAKSNKHWTVDPQGIAWETFHSLGSIPVYGTDEHQQATDPAACCAPDAKLVALAQGATCCGPNATEKSPAKTACCG